MTTDGCDRADLPTDPEKFAIGSSSIESHSDERNAITRCRRWSRRRHDVLKSNRILAIPPLKLPDSVEHPLVEDVFDIGVVGAVVDQKARMEPDPRDPGREAGEVEPDYRR
jgi:hypothetical protein